MPNISDDSFLKTNFNQNRQSVHNAIKNYLNKEASQLVSVEDCFKLANENIAQGNLIAAIKNLEIARDSKRGIIAFEYKNDENNSPIFIRDARKCAKENLLEGIEAAQILVLTYFEAAKDVLQLTNNNAKEDEINKMAAKFFVEFTKNNSDKNQKQLLKSLDLELHKITDFLKSQGIKNATNLINQALHFQNFKQQENCNIATISEIEDNQNKKHLVIEANIAFRGITQEQQKLYDKVAESSSISDLQKKLMKKYREQFFSGKYVIPTQLIDVTPGIRNAFEEITILVEDVENKTEIKAQDLSIIDVRNRCGAICSLLKDNKLAHEVSESNIKQIDSFFAHQNDKKIHWNSLNTGSPNKALPINIDDFNIVARSKKIVDGKNHKLSVTPFNAFRSIPNVGDFAGIRNYLKDFVNSINVDSKDNKVIKNHLKSSGFLSGFFNSEKNYYNAVSKIEDEDCQKIFTLAKDLKSDLKKLSRSFIFGLDKENIRLGISNKFNALNKAVNDMVESENTTFLKVFDIDKVPYEEIIVFCKSGKDRTGLSMFCQEVHRIQDKLNISFEKAAKQLHFSGHIESLPGSIRVGGGTPGCYQLLDSIIPAIPKSQKDYLQDLSGPFAAKNKMPKKTSFFSKLKNFFFGEKELSKQSDKKDVNSNQKNDNDSLENNKGANLAQQNLQNEKNFDNKAVSSFTTSQLKENSMQQQMINN